jgi:pimeloyl-ACP methyl ester carboxylesterase
MMFVEKSFDTGEVALNYAEGPDNGPPLVLFPGASRRWQSHLLPIMIPLSNRWHIYAVDNRGHGKSGRTPGKYSLADYTRDAVAFLDHMDEPAAIFGHSLGGMICPGAAVGASDKVKAAILGDPPVTNRSARAWLTQDLAIDWNNDLIELTGSEFSIWEIAERLGDGPVTAGNLMYARTIKDLDPSMPEAINRTDEFFEGYDMDEMVKQVQCPVLLIQGDPEMFSAMTEEDVEYVKGNVSNVVHVRLDGVGHGLGLGDWRAEQVVSAMYYFLESIR